MPTTTVATTEIELWYDEFGEVGDPPLVLIMGLATQAIAWEDDFCEGLVDRGFRVIRFDNRDIGLSQDLSDAPGASVDLGALLADVIAGKLPEPPYRIADMAEDTLGLLDHLGIDRAHVVGASMGGMIAQQLAIDHADRVATLTSIMSTTGEAAYGQASPTVMSAFVAPPPTGREAVIDRSVEVSRMIGSPDLLDEAIIRAQAERAYDRSFRPEGAARQLAAILASPDRAAGLRELRVPTLVIHGDADPLVAPSGGERTAELVEGAELVVIPGMGHDLPPNHWALVIESVTSLVARNAT
ncbi:MAG: alpha/beta fold hydrolase [Actinomycetota bacterium]|nr:alpha/beta fold hydrolase [Actinomycetota bacterium]